MRSFHHCCAPVIFLAASLPHLAVAQYSVLNSFSPVAPEAYPKCTLVEISPGVFLGSNSQEVFRITSAGVLEDVVNFANNRAYNYVLPGALAPSSDGRYYGVEYSINPGNEGEIFYISAAGTAPVIARGPLKNVFPMTEAADGDLYGTVAAGPRGFALFKLTLGGTMTDLTGGLTGEFGGPPLQASDGNFYGVSSFTTARLSAVYRITPSGELKVLYTLPSGETGAGPLMQATNGLIYGTAVFDPQPSCSADTPVGEIFSVSLSGQYQTVQTLTGCNASTINGTIAGPQAGLLEASDGYLYGSTVASGADGYGTIFRLLPDGSGLENVFAFDHASGSAPQTYGPAVVQGSDGVLYGSAAFAAAIKAAWCSGWISG